MLHAWGAEVSVDFDAIRVESSAAQLREARRRVAGSAPGQTEIKRGWYPAQQEMASAVTDPPTTISGVLARLDTVQQILDGLPPGGGTNRWQPSTSSTAR